MQSADAHGDITPLQDAAIKAAAKRVGCKENEMASYFVNGEEWDATTEKELEELLVDVWNDQQREWEAGRESICPNRP